MGLHFSCGTSLVLFLGKDRSSNCCTRPQMHVDMANCHLEAHKQQQHRLVCLLLLAIVYSLESISKRLGSNDPNMMKTSTIKVLQPGWLSFGRA